MIPRHITSEIDQALARQAAVALIGPRQAGKTTLALAIGETRNALYLDLEDRDDRNRLTNPTLFFENVEDRLVILDEIHRIPEIFETLRGVIDKGRRKNKGKNRFLIIGSAAINLLRQSETLAGRIAYIEMTPLTATEVEDNRRVRERLWLRGGFPDAYLADTDAESLAMRKDFIRTYLERDVPMFGPRIPATTLERLWTMLAHTQGMLLNASQIARALEVSTQSVMRYIDLLSDLLLVRRLLPLHANVGKRLVKSPKVYIRDSGLVHTLLGLETLTQLSGHPVVCQSWEGFVIETVLAAAPWRSQASFYRTSAGAEIDLVLEHKNGHLWAIEIKRGLSVKPRRGFYQAIKDITPKRSFIVHAGDDRYPIAERVEAIGICDLVGELRSSEE
jgi:predicted AAA+ superfamily ATPase